MEAKSLTSQSIWPGASDQHQRIFVLATKVDPGDVFEFNLKRIDLPFAARADEVQHHQLIR